MRFGITYHYRMVWLSGEVRTLLIVAACLLLLKFVLNLTRYLRIKRYLTKYKKWLYSRDMKFLETKAQVVRLLKEADVKDGRVSVSQEVGYGHLQVAQVSILDNFPNLDQGISDGTQRMFYEAIGTYRARMLDTFNPLYWIESLIYLPRELLSYLGVPAESVVVKIGQVVWWILALALTTVLALYRPELRTFVEGLF